MFLKAEVFDHTFDTSRADLQAGLSDLLRNHLSRRVRVKESMPHDVTGHLLGTAVWAFWSAFLAHQGLGAMQAKGLANVIGPRRAEAECLRRLARTEGTPSAILILALNWYRATIVAQGPGA